MITSLHRRGAVRELHVNGAHVADIARAQYRASGKATWRAVRPVGHCDEGVTVGTSEDLGVLVAKLERRRNTSSESSR